MTSGKQVEANQRNARLSTGPKTPEGKRVVARNATRLGLWSKDVVMAGEDQDEFDEFEEGFLDEVNPVGAVETWLAHEVVASAWRLRRVRRVEAEILAEQSFAEKDSVPTLGRAYLNDCRGLNALSKLARDESRIERAMYRAYHELQRLQAVRAGQYVPPPTLAEVDVNIGIAGSGGSSSAAPNNVEASVVECVASSGSH